MLRPRLTEPGNTDLHWMSVTCAPEKTSVEFHEEQPDAIDAAAANLAPTVSTYVGHVTHQGEHPKRPPGRVCVLEVRVDNELLEALKRVALISGQKWVLGRKGLNKILTGLLAGQLQAIRDEYLAGNVTVQWHASEPPDPPGTLSADGYARASSAAFTPWAKCKSIDECEAMGRCCNGCQGKL